MPAGQRAFAVLCSLVLLACLLNGSLAGVGHPTSEPATHPTPVQGTRGKQYQLDTAAKENKDDMLMMMGLDAFESLGSEIFKGDLNGDGKEDLVLPGRETIRITYGTSKEELESAVNNSRQFWVSISSEDYWVEGRTKIAVGDMDGDGYDDVAFYVEEMFDENFADGFDPSDSRPSSINTNKYPEAENYNTGIFVYLGGPKPLKRKEVRVESSPHLFFPLNSTEGKYFSEVNFGDLDGDGFSDLFISYHMDRYYYDDDIYEGGPKPTPTPKRSEIRTRSGDGTARTRNERTLQTNQVIFGGNRSSLPSLQNELDHMQMELTVTGTGEDPYIEILDWNNDGADDILYNFINYDYGIESESLQLCLLYGGERFFPGATIDMDKSPDIWFNVKIDEDSYSAYVGEQIAHGDLNGDGHLDIAFSTEINWEFSVTLILGSPTIDGEVWVNDLDTISFKDEDGYFYGGLALADMDGDGYDDMIIGDSDYSQRTENLLFVIPQWRWSCGAVFVFPGSADPGRSSYILEDHYKHKLIGPHEGGSFGITVIGADLDGDGKDEIITGSPYYTPDMDIYMEPGAVFIFYQSDITDDRFILIPEEFNTALCVVPIIILIVLILAFIFMIVILKRRPKKNDGSEQKDPKLPTDTDPQMYSQNGRSPPFS